MRLALIQGGRVLMPWELMACLTRADALVAGPATRKSPLVIGRKEPRGPRLYLPSR